MNRFGVFIYKRANITVIFILLLLAPAIFLPRRVVAADCTIRASNRAAFALRALPSAEGNMLIGDRIRVAMGSGLSRAAFIH